MAAYYRVDVSLNTNAVSVGLPSPQSVRVTLPLVGPQGPPGQGGGGAVDSVNGQTGVVVLGAADVGATSALEFLSVSLTTTDNFNLAANKHYTFTKNFSGDTKLLLPSLANDGDRVVVRRGGGDTGGVLFVSRTGGVPFVQDIGALTAPNTVFYAVWSGLWRQDFVPPAGFQGAPASPSGVGVAGQLAYQDPYLYVCVSTNDWRRVPVATW